LCIQIRAPELAALLRPPVQQIGLVLGDLVRVVDLAVVDPAGVDIERHAEQGLADMTEHSRCQPGAPRPQGESHSIWRLLARRGLAPDREVGGVALALDRFDPPFPVLGHGAGQAAVVGHGRDVEIEPAVELVAVLVRDLLGPVDHRLDIFGRARMRTWPAGGRSARARSASK
jgi:hypothetical protein